MVTANEAAILFRLSEREIHRMLDDGKLHFTETSEGLLLICINSFLA